MTKHYKDYDPNKFELNLKGFGPFMEDEKMSLGMDPHGVGVRLTLYIRTSPERFDELMRNADTVTRDGIEIDYGKKDPDSEVIE